jgi:hypothetical protein
LRSCVSLRVGRFGVAVGVVLLVVLFVHMFGLN